MKKITLLLLAAALCLLVGCDKTNTPADTTAEVEAAKTTVTHSIDKLRRIQAKREEARDKARTEWLDALTR